ncbi:MAG: hypothetical protein Ta2D_12630 [Rickettsiales bacterium]|nr:MAG: hypothetical protein Ta2D_12630 [Rickettsiales bacterium]
MNKIFILSILILSACGTIFTGTTTEINILSDYDVEISTLSNRQMQKMHTPATIKVNKGNNNLTITITDRCFEKENFTIYPKINTIAAVGWFFAYIDYFTGALWTYNDTITINPTPNGMCRI